MATNDIADLVGTTWEGTSELWLDPLGDVAKRSECTLRVGSEGARHTCGYTWSYEGEAHEGAIELEGDRASWSDSWHQPEAVECAHVEGAWGLFTLHYTYAAGEGPRWGWRIALARRPSGELVLQMTNIAPWGEEARAVRMVLTQKP